MPKPIEKYLYLTVKTTYKSPIEVIHALYNLHCDVQHRVPNINQFEIIFRTWVGRKNMSSLKGCLIIIKKFDSQFAQK